MSAIFLHSEMPPAEHVSGWTMSTARIVISSRKPKRVNSHSPLAIGMVSAARTSRWPATSSGGTGSSNQAMSKGSAKSLALDVPQRDVDAAQALDDRALLAVVAKARVDFVPEPLRAERILV